MLSSRDLIKIDVEGMALSVLQGADKTLREVSPRHIIELHSGDEQVPQYLQSLGYRTQHISWYFIIAYKS